MSAEAKRANSAALAGLNLPLCDVDTRLTPDLCLVVLDAVANAHYHEWEGSNDFYGEIEEHYACGGHDILACALIRQGLRRGMPWTALPGLFERYADRLVASSDLGSDEMGSIERMRAMLRLLDLGSQGVGNERADVELIQEVGDTEGRLSTNPVRRVWGAMLELACCMHRASANGGDVAYQAAWGGREVVTRIALADGGLVDELLAELGTIARAGACAVSNHNGGEVMQQSEANRDAGRLAGLQRWFEHTPAGEACPPDFCRDDPGSVRCWNVCSEVGEVARDFITRGGDPVALAAVLIDAVDQDCSQEEARLLGWARALCSGELGVASSAASLVEDMLSKLVDDALETEPNAALVLALSAGIAFGWATIAADAAAVVRDLMMCGAFLGCDSDGNLTERGRALSGALANLLRSAVH